MTRICHFLAIVCLLIGPASWADDGKALLQSFLDDVDSLSANFEQQLVDADNVVVEESSGTLEIHRPGRFRWDYSEPFEQLMIADGLNVWSYDVDLDQVTVKGQAEALGNTPALLLGGTRSVMDDFDYIGSAGQDGTVWVELRPKSDENGFTRVDLGFNEGVIRRMMFTDNLQQSTLIVLHDVAVNTEIPEERFHFDPPRGADVVGIPLVADE